MSARLKFMTIVYRTKAKGEKKRVFGFSISEEQYNFMKEHKEVNWRATMRESLSSTINEVKQKNEKSDIHKKQ